MRADRWLVSRAALLVIAVAAGPACDPVLGPRPLDDNWRVFEGPRVSFYVRPGSAAEQNVARLSEVIEDQYTATVAALRLTYAGHVRGYAYDSPSDANFETNASGRAYPETESFRFVCVAPVNANTFGLMQHEANHVLVINGLGRAGTYFMTEGLATALVSERFHSNGRHFLFPWTKAHRAELPRLSRLVDDGEWGNVRSDIAYNTSASFLAWLLDTYGPDPLRATVGAASSEFAGRIASVYGRSLDALEEDWLRFCDSWVG
jgi:hypothetical protein